MTGWVPAVSGAIAGSVANAVIYRLPRGVSWARGTSVCPHCKHKLQWYDLIPLLSYVWLGARCRYCTGKISLRYFLVELVMAVGFGYLSGLGNLSNLGILWVTVVIAAIDWETMLVSDWLVGVWAALVVLANWPNSANWANWGGVALALGLVGGIWVISRGRAMGFGDVEIAAVAGLWLGWPRIAPALWISFIAGAVYGLWLIVHSQKTMKSKIAFGPFLILGAWTSYLVNTTFLIPFLK